MTQIQAKISSPPCEDLYIYLIKGVLRQDDEALLGDNFLGNWVEDESSFLFFSKPSRDRITRLLAARPGLDLDDEFHFAYDEWQGGGVDPITIDRFLIAPPWLESLPRQDLITILMDPGVVFGNCHHPTTQACLKALSLVAGETPLGRVLDLGTGTGVLALAAARLRTAARNVELNNLTEIVRVIEAKAEDLADDPADMIVANIHYEVVEQLLEQNAFNRSANLIVSGLMRSQHRDIIIRLKRTGFHPVREWDHDMTWHTVLARREDGARS
jgi:ribosomal protein L11 methyltransferase